MPESHSNPHGLGIDHLLFVSENIGRSAESFEKLGFTLTRPSLHSAHLGTINQTMMFEEDYIELIAVNTITPHNQLHRDSLKAGEGWHVTAITTDSIEGTRKALSAAGIPTGEPISFSRPVTLPDGQTAEAAFQVVRPERQSLPNGFMFFCNHHTPQNLWVSEWMQHANTARGLAAVVISTDTPDVTAMTYRSLFASGELTKVEGGITFTTPKSALNFLTPDRIHQLYSSFEVQSVGSPNYKVVQIRVRDLDAAEHVMKNNGVAVSISSTGSLLPPPDRSCGTLVEFVADGVPSLTSMEVQG